MIAWYDYISNLARVTPYGGDKAATVCMAKIICACVSLSSHNRGPEWLKGSYNPPLVHFLTVAIVWTLISFRGCLLVGVIILVWAVYCFRRSCVNYVSDEKYAEGMDTRISSPHRDRQQPRSYICRREG